MEVCVVYTHIVSSENTGVYRFKWRIRGFKAWNIQLEESRAFDQYTFVTKVVSS
jgi:hypothetical protein